MICVIRVNICSTNTSDGRCVDTDTCVYFQFIYLFFQTFMGGGVSVVSGVHACAS